MGDVVGVAADAVFPVRAAVTLVGRKNLAVAFIDVFQEINEGRISQFRVRVLTVPTLDERRRAGDEIGVFDLSAVDQDRVGLVIGVRVGLEEHRQRVAYRPKRGRQAEEALHLHVVARVPEKNLLAVRAFPPERRFLIPPAVEQEGSAPIVSGCDLISDARAREHRGVGARVGGNVGDVRVIKREPVTARQCLGSIEGPVERLE